MSTQRSIDWQNLHGITLFLSCFRTPHTYHEVAQLADWSLAFPEDTDPDTLLQRLIADGYLEPDEPDEPPAQRLQKLTVPKLRDLCSDRRLSKIPPKDDLIDRLIQHDPEGMERLALRLTLLKCTADTAQTSERYLEEGVKDLPEEQILPPDQLSSVLKFIRNEAARGIIGSVAFAAVAAVYDQLKERPLPPPRRLSFEPELVRVPAGPFWMGSHRNDQQAYDNEFPRHRVNLRAYQIGRYPVTNAQYAAFVRATRRDPPSLWNDGRIPKELDNHPVVAVTWHDAQAYVTWLRKQTGRSYRLPTEAEWEKAARGTDGRIYPWGNNWDPRRCNSSEGGPGETTPVGQYSPAGDSPYHCADMAGNVVEWTSTLRGNEWAPPQFKYPYNPKDGRENLRAGDDVLRVVRGGLFYFDQWFVRCAYRSWGNPDLRLSVIGFRVVAPVPSDPLIPSALLRASSGSLNDSRQRQRTHDQA